MSTRFVRVYTLLQLFYLIAICILKAKPGLVILRVIVLNNIALMLGCTLKPSPYCCSVISGTLSTMFTK